MRLVVSILINLVFLSAVKAQTHSAVERFLSAPYMKGASVSLMIKDMRDGKVIVSHDSEREVIPASVLKIVTTAAALELLGENFRYETAIMYDGRILNHVLHGNLYIRGSGDPSLGSSEMKAGRDKIIREWVTAIKNVGIHKITGAVIADERIFDFEGISMKWLREDMGSYYAPGSYGLNIFDNSYSLFLNSGEPNSRPEIVKCEPELPSLIFHNYLKTVQAERDSSYIIGLPHTNERYLYRTVPANRFAYQLKGDIPYPPLFLAQYLTKLLENEQITIDGIPACYHVLSQDSTLQKTERKILTTTYSPPLKDLVHITNHVSHNLYADALLKTIGIRYRTDEVISSFDKGIHILNQHWIEKGLNPASLRMFDGCGLALTDKITAAFLCEVLSYMANQSSVSKSFTESLPRAGMDGTVANTLRNSDLHGNARLKSGSMSRVRSYAGYITKENQSYAVAIIVNNFSCNQSQMKTDIERLLLSLYAEM